MRTVFAFSLLLIFLSPTQNPSAPQQASPVGVSEFKWYKARQPMEKLEPAGTGPAAAMSALNKNFPRNARINDPAGAIDPNTQTTDGRAAAIEKMVQESRMPKVEPVDGFAYRVKVQNASSKEIETVFWEYQFIDRSAPENIVHRQFLCAVHIKSDKAKELNAFSLTGPPDVVSVKSLANQSGDAFQEKVLINRVEYTDGSSWYRKDWNIAEIKQSYKIAIARPWGSEMCRLL